MSLKEEWKQTGKGIGKAFRQVGKTVAMSAISGLEVATQEVSEEEAEEFIDETWNKTGKGIETAFSDLGKNIVKSAKYGVNKIDSED